MLAAIIRGAGLPRHEVSAKYQSASGPVDPEIEAAGSAAGDRSDAVSLCDTGPSKVTT